MKLWNKVLAMLLVLALCLGLAACGAQPSSSEPEEPSSSEESSSEESSSEESEVEPEPEIDTPLVVAYDPFSEKFSPFFADTAYDQDVVGMTQLGLMTTDRVGGIIYNAIEGETVAYNGTDYTYTGPANITVTVNDEDPDNVTTTYRIQIRDDIVFSDGHPMDIDDVIFNYYVYCDPSYTGSTTLSSYAIVGLQDYLTQTTSELYDKYKAIVEAIYAAGEGYTATADDIFTQEQYDAFWAAVADEWKADIWAIANYCMANYLGAYATEVADSAETISGSEDWQLVFGCWAWGFGAYNDDGLFELADGTTYDVNNGTFPTIDDVYASVYATYEGDAEAYWGVEAADSSDVVGTAMNACISAFAADEPELEGGIPNIAGIQRIDDYTVEVTTLGFEAPAVYSICGLTVAPLHYYGDESMYDYENNQFGFPYGDLSAIQAKTTVPVGAGPYKFVEYANKVVYFEANENYYKGEPKIQQVQFIETAEADKISAIQTGTADISNPSGSVEKLEEIRKMNSNGELQGDVIFTSLVDNLGYGYIGINADTVSVDGDPASDASKNLRRAFATIMSVYRDVAIDSYYSDMADVINYPISNTSWAAPQKSDADYQVAFSVDVDGNPIYTSDMTAEDKYAAALNAAVGFLKAAGFTFDEEAGVFTAAPTGAKLDYEVLIPADGIGDHPSFMVLSEASNALATIGITLTVTDLSDSSVLWERIDASTQEIWAAAWGSTIDPDMYQVYHSSGIVGRGGSDSNHYRIDDAELDQLIVDARMSADNSYRKSVYKACLDRIIDWAVEIPTYQRQNVYTFSSERINIDTLTPDITTYWGWMAEVELLEMN